MDRFTNALLGFFGIVIAFPLVRPFSRALAKATDKVPCINVGLTPEDRYRESKKTTCMDRGSISVFGFDEIEVPMVGKPERESTGRER